MIRIPIHRDQDAWNLDYSPAQWHVVAKKLPTAMAYGSLINTVIKVEQLGFESISVIEFPVVYGN